MKKNLLLSICVLIGSMAYPAQVATAGEAVQEQAFTLEMIENWTGEGANSAALAIQWADPEGRIANAMVFGYHWDGDATNEQMIEAIVKNNPRLYALWSPGWTGGINISGWGWDYDNDGAIGLYDTDENQEYDDPEGWYANPNQYAWTFSNWEPLDFDGDVFQATSNWNYFVKATAADAFKKAGMGFTTTDLTDGYWIGFIYASETDYGSKSWGLLESAPALAAEEQTPGFEVDGVCYEVTNKTRNEVAVCAPFQGASFDTYTGAVTVAPAITVDEATYRVTGVSAEAFRNSQATSVVLPASVSSIGDYAFAESSIETVNLDQVKTLGVGLFMGCANVKAWLLPATIAEVPAYTFAGTGFAELEIPSHVTTLGENAFANCAALNTITIHDTMQSIAECAFGGCDALQTVKVEAQTPLEINQNTFSDTAYATATLFVPIGAKADYEQAAGWGKFVTIVEYAKDVNVGDIFEVVPYTYQVTSVINKATAAIIRGDIAGDVIIPDNAMYQNVRFIVDAIGENAFKDCTELTSAVVPQSVATIGEGAFRNCSALVSVTLPDDIAKLPDYMFSGCSSLTSFDMPASVTEVGQYIFSGCGALAQLSIAPNVTTIPKRMCENCKSLVTIVMPTTVTAFGDGAFYRCESIKAFELPNTITSLPENLFFGCKALEAIVIPETVTTIGRFCFNYCYALQNVVLPSTLTEIPVSFTHCIALKHIDIPTTVKSISGAAFQGSALEAIELPDGLEKIGEYAFYDCPIKTIEIPASVTTLGQQFVYVFDRNKRPDLAIYFVDPDAITSKVTAQTIQLSTSVYPTIYVPCGKVEEYMFKDGWKYADIKEIPIAEWTFGNHDVAVEATSATIKVVAEPNFDATHPQRFIAAHKPNVLPHTNAMLELRKAGETEWSAIRATAGEAGTYVATLEGLQEGTRYEYRWVIEHGNDNLVTSDVFELEIATSGIGEIVVDTDATYAVYDLAGRKVGTADKLLTLSPGIYVIVNQQNAADTRKIVVK